MKKKLLAMFLCVGLASIRLKGAEVHEPAVTVGGIDLAATQSIGGNGADTIAPTTLVFAGGGLRMGQTIGESTAKGEEPKSEPIGFEGLLGTLWHTLFDVGQLRLKPGLPRELLSEIERAGHILQLVS